MDVSIKVEGVDKAGRALSNFAVSLMDLKDSMEETGDYLTKFFAGEVFASRGRVIGKPWPDLNPAYEVEKAMDFPGAPPLIRTGLMNSSFESTPARLSVKLWNRVDYFDYHQEGRGVPQRVMMDVDKTRIRKVAAFIVKDIKAKARKSGL